MPSVALVRLRRHVDVDWRRGGDEQARRFLIRVAKTGHALFMAKYALQRASPVVVAYANRPGIPVEQVRLPGPIVYEYHPPAQQVLAEIISAALKELRAASPVVTGEYRHRHTLYIDGVPVDPSGDDAGFIDSVLRRARPDAEIMIANPVPYARRLEIGVTKSGRAFVVQVPPRIYDRVGARLAERFNDQAELTVSEDPGVELPDAGEIRGVSGRSGVSSHHPSGGRRVARRTHGGERILSPALFIKLRPAIESRDGAPRLAAPSLPLLTFG